MQQPTVLGNPGISESDLQWMRLQMRRLRRAIDLLPDLDGVRIACSTHLDEKMIPAFEGLLERGASLFLSTCNGATVRDEVVEHFADSHRVQTNAWRGMGEQCRQKSLWKALAWKPTHLCEIGGEMTFILHGQNAIASSVRASVEATSTGVKTIDDLALRYPVFNWNNVPIKEHLHNRRMVGISTWHTFFERTRLTLHEKNVVVIGYGAVGQSLADSAKAYGGTVIVVERDRGRALEARYAGWNVLSLDEALPIADVVVTATGRPGILGWHEFRLMKSGVFLLNAGHRTDEIDVDTLRNFERRAVIPYVDEIQLGRLSASRMSGNGHCESNQNQQSDLQMQGDVDDQAEQAVLPSEFCQETEELDEKEGENLSPEQELEGQGDAGEIDADLPEGQNEEEDERLHWAESGRVSAAMISLENLIETEEHKIIYLFADGSMANLTAGYGDSINAFDLTLAIMIAAIGHAVTAADDYRPRVHLLPTTVWQAII